MTAQEKLHQRLAENPFLTNTQLAGELLFEDILSGELAPGERLNQEALAVRYEMSRSPIRDAVAQLEKEGFVSRTPQGCFVAGLCGADYLDFSEFRARIESIGAEWAARFIEPAELAALEENLKAFCAGLDDPDRLAMSRLDEAFHLLVVKACRNQNLIATVNGYQKKLLFYRRQIVNKQVFRGTYANHCDIYQALARHDERAAQAATYAHLLNPIRTALLVGVTGEQQG